MSLGGRGYQKTKVERVSIRDDENTVACELDRTYLVFLGDVDGWRKVVRMAGLVEFVLGGNLAVFLYRISLFFLVCPSVRDALFSCHWAHY